MGRVFVDASALLVAPASGGRRALAPGAVEAVDRLVESGHETFLVGRRGGELDRLLARAQTITRLPDDLHGCWLITGDPRRCDDPRPGCRTVVVGPSLRRRVLPTRHCDDEVRDLNQAVLLVLTEEAMPTGT